MRATPIVLFALTLAGQAGPPRFEPVQPELFGAGASLTNAWADADGDGDLDLFVGFNGQPNRLYRNDSARFTEVAVSAGTGDARATRAAAWGDFDGDGDPDLLVGFTPAAGPVLRLYRNDGMRFTDVTMAAGLRVDSAAVRQPAWVDFDGDGDLDLFVAFRDRANALFENDNGNFHDVAVAVGVADTRRTVGAVWFDFDADGDLDLYVGNMDGDANGLFRNDGHGFTDIAASLGLEWGGRAPGDPDNGTVRPCAADVDNDGRFDLFMANYGPNGLFLNRGGTFEDVSTEWGIALDSRYDSCAFGDWDNDGLLDVYANGTVTGGVVYRDHLFRNHGGGYTDVTPDVLLRMDSDHGVQWADFDGDGALDLALTTAAADGSHPLLRNLMPAEQARRGLNVLVRDATLRALGPGAEVRIRSAATGALIGARLVDSGSGYNAQSVVPLHFGLAEADSVDIEVIVPRNGQRTVAVLRRVNVRELTDRTLVLRYHEDGRLERLD